MGVRSIAGTRSWPSLPGLSPSREVPDDHCPIHCPRYHPRGGCPGTAGRRSRRQSEPAGQDGRDRSVLRQVPGCCVHSGCIRRKHDAAKATKKRSDEGRCHYRPVVTLTHSAWLVNRSLPVWTPACRCAMSKRPPHMLTRGPRFGTTGPAEAWTDTPPTSSPPTSRALPGNPHGLASAPPGGCGRQADSPVAARYGGREAIRDRDLARQYQDGGQEADHRLPAVWPPRPRWRSGSGHR